MAVIDRAVHALNALHPSSTVLLSSRGESDKKSAEDLFVLCLTAPKWIKLQFIKVDTDLTCFHCTSSLAYFWEQQAVSRHLLQFNLLVMLLKLHLCVLCSSNSTQKIYFLNEDFCLEQERRGDTHNLLLTSPTFTLLPRAEFSSKGFEMSQQRTSKCFIYRMTTFGYIHLISCCSKSRCNTADLECAHFYWHEQVWPFLSTLPAETPCICLLGSYMKVNKKPRWTLMSVAEERFDKGALESVPLNAEVRTYARRKPFTHFKLKATFIAAN